MRRRRTRGEAASLEVTAFINLIVVLVPFLLSTTVFTRLAVMDLALPASTGTAAPLSSDRLQLELVLRRDHLDVTDRIAGLIERIPAGAEGPDLGRLDVVLDDLKARYPAEASASLLAEPQTPYEQIVQVMDHTRARVQAQGATLQRTPRFPEIAIGDAPAASRP